MYTVSDDLYLRSLCVHEAAHAVVAWREGISVEFMKIERTFWTGSVSHAYTRVAGWGWYSEEEAAPHATVYCAGAIGQEKYLLKQGVSPAVARHNAEWGGSWDQQDLEHLRRDFPDAFSPAAARDKAEVIVEEHLELIFAVGDLLYERGKVSGRVAR